MPEAAQVIETPPSTQVAEFQPFEVSLAEYKARYQDVVYDMTDKKQEKQARSDRLAIGKVVAELDRTHATVKAPLLEQVRILDGERKRIKDDLLSVQEGVKSQIAAHEAKLQAIEDALVARVDAITALAVFEFAPTSDQVMSRLLALKKIAVDDTYAHHAANALLAHKTAMAALNDLYDQVSQAESDAAELKRLQQEAADRERADREAQIAAEAAAKAKQEADAARIAAEEAAARAKADADAAIERERQATLAAQKAAAEAQERAEQEARDANVREEHARIKAKRDADEAARLATEAAEKAQRDAAEREQKEREAREHDEIHREIINDEIVTALSQSGISLIAAKKVVYAILSGNIPHIKINY
jgi:colicin import membrane protein